MAYDMKLKNMVTLVKDKSEYNSGTYGDKISKELGMYDDFIFFSDIFLRNYLYKKGFNKSGKLYSTFVTKINEDNYLEYFENEVISFNNDELLLYMPNDRLWGVFTESDESCERLLNSLKKFKNEFKKVDAHVFIHMFLGKVRNWDQNQIEKIHAAANKHLTK